MMSRSVEMSGMGGRESGSVAGSEVVAGAGGGSADAGRVEGALAVGVACADAPSGRCRRVGILDGEERLLRYDDQSRKGNTGTCPAGVSCY